MNLPTDFIQYTKTLMGDDLFVQLTEGLSSKDSSVSIRLNPFKCPEGTKVTMEDGRVPWSEYGYYLTHRPNFTFDPLLHAGAYYVQEASSMFIEHVIRQILNHHIPHPMSVLDLCAAPGGKSIAARTALPDDCILYSNEPIRSRAQILWENMQKMGHPQVVVTNNYARDFQQARMSFDIIIADVPCSGEGMFRKDPNAISEWSVKNVEKCWRLQREIVADIWPCLKSNGIMVYSTCTFNAHENEENVAWIANELGADFISIDIQEDWNITGSLTDNHPVYRFIPGKTRGEGLFMAILKKKNKENAETCRGGSAYPPANNPYPQKGKSRANTLICPYNTIASKTSFKIDIPPHSKALSIIDDNKEYPHIDIDYTQAINYLRKEAIILPTDTPKGIVLLTYQNIPIGFAKNIGNRANNLYPQEWKIKSTHIPKYETILELARPHPDGGHEED
ncbi:MAG: hypothetical protein J5867_00760 [Prevotella sp.]|nr:hypothetical protein [Prevotella sp.]